MQLIRCDNSLLSLLLLLFFKHYTIWNKKNPYGRQTRMKVFPFNISLLAVRCDLYCQFPTVACFTQPWQNLSVMAEIQYIKRDTFGIFTSNNKDHCWECLCGREKSLKWRRGGRQSTQPETKEQVRTLANIQLVASSPSSCSAVLFFSRAVNEKQSKRLLFLSRREKKQKKQGTKHPASLTPQIQVNMWVRKNISLRIKLA